METSKKYLGKINTQSTCSVTLNEIILCLQGVVSLFTSGDPTLYSFQQSLPRLPVPSLDATLDKVIPSNQVRRAPVAQTAWGQQVGFFYTNYTL